MAQLVAHVQLARCEAFSSNPSITREYQGQHWRSCCSRIFDSPVTHRWPPPAGEGGGQAQAESSLHMAAEGRSLRARDRDQTFQGPWGTWRVRMSRTVFHVAERWGGAGKDRKGLYAWRKKLGRLVREAGLAYVGLGTTRGAVTGAPGQFSLSETRAPVPAPPHPREECVGPPPQSTTLSQAAYLL